MNENHDLKSISCRINQNVSKQILVLENLKAKKIAGFKSYLRFKKNVKMINQTKKIDQACIPFLQ